MRNKINFRNRYFLGKIAILSMMFFTVCAYAQAPVAIPDLAAPSNTIVSDKNVETKEVSVNYQYTYSSTLPKDQIIQFYRNLFVFQQRMYEVSSVDSNVLVFQKIPLKTVSIGFMPSPKKEKLEYIVTMIEIKKLPALPATDFKIPQPLDFIPIYSNTTQFLYYAAPTSPFIGIGYLTHNSPDDVKSFFLSQMPASGWKLTKEEPRSGTFQFTEWLTFIDPYTQILTYHDFAAGFQAIIPPLKLHGATYTFEQGSKKCTLAVYKFEDMLEKAHATKTVWDVSPFEKYGDTIIEVYYFYK